MRRLLLRLIGCAVLSGWPNGPAKAVTCNMIVSPLAFGNYNPFANTPTDTTANVQVACNTLVSLLVTYTLSLSAGNNTLRDRQMRGDRFLLPYQVYTDAARSQVWGDGTSGTGTQSNSYLLAAASTVTSGFTAYGRILSKQNIGPGSYSDMLMVTITY